MQRGFTWAAALLLVSGAAFAPPAFAQGAVFTCPKPGTVETRGNLTFQYSGASSKDPYFCTGTSAEGKPMARLFNFYAYVFVKDSPSMQDILLPLFAGKQNTATITLKSGSTETWTYLRTEPLVVGGKTFNTKVFSYVRKCFANSRAPFEGHYTRWLDPMTGLWLKATLDKVDGQIAREYPPYTDTAISIP